MSMYEATGKSVEEAISEGLSHLGLGIADVEVEILDEGSKGLFGLFGSKMARVRLTVKDNEGDGEHHNVFAGSLDSYTAGRAAARQPKQAPKAAKAAKEPAEQPKTREPKPRAQAPAARETGEEQSAAKRAPRARGERKPKEGEKAREPRAPREPREVKPAAPPTPAEQRDPATTEGKVQAFLQELTRLMNVPVSVHVKTDEEGNVRVNMEGDTLGILIGRRGETLDALQYLTSLHLNRGQDDYTRVTLDSEGYRAKREDALIRLANRMANRAQKTGRKVSMEPMNPYERRILHSALQNHPGISTHSEGEEPNRHVVITLNKGGDGAEEAQDEA